jgi:hypothetical protein
MGSEVIIVLVMTAIAVAFVVWIKMNDSKSEADAKTEKKSVTEENR